jgi:hypothetical protein
MKTIKEWIARIQRQDGLIISKERLIQEIRKSSKNTFPIEHDKGAGIIILAVPVKNSFEP